jgi:DNA-binding NarL/FixJ family response regulator
MKATERDDAIVHMTLEGLSSREIGHRVKVTQRTVSRVRRLMGVAQEVNPRLTREQRARIDRLIDEGMPATWIAEDVGCSDQTVRRYRQSSEEDTRVWRQVFAFVMRSSVLVELHREFAPKTVSGHLVRRDAA